MGKREREISDLVSRSSVSVTLSFLSVFACCVFVSASAGHNILSDLLIRRRFGYNEMAGFGYN